ncbi:hypothetical protein H8356DRAFT_1696139 [Neocallimastix lanati (nom. inval.)]|uniref:At4g15545-like C-terminal domain-containing protein n=1 Tax=Neocallimastix californiae TaxID=1754190 RepID=A0A1Y2DS69_9FUNG|nr:hypothetical protein H8356DRAFT_1696139 [Neocallimastix sp. JGI-2020a]ORY61966.1 hypothetical protein LY90DRAFT_701043 [Neocallimastix californiae]|eukprot:ORY61966.1 hypothetical protein LY90DRAFT_701043 [Neocallimastix californiae]
MNSSSLNLESEFENAVSAVRNAFNNKITEKNSEVVLLKNQLFKKQNEIKEYIQKIEQLENYIYKCDKKMNEMSKTIAKLTSFKKNVLQSFGEEDLEEYKNKDNSDDFLQTGEINSRNNFKNSLSSLKLNSNSSSESTSTLVSNKYDLDYLAKKESLKKSYDSPVLSEEQTETIDGRDFFKLARIKLSYDQFTSLLNNVKAYNNRDQGKEKTLENIEIALGEEHHDLYEQFEQLLRIY